MQVIFEDCYQIVTSKILISLPDLTISVNHIFGRGEGS